MTTPSTHPLESLAAAQRQRNDGLLAATPLMNARITSSVLPFALDPAAEALAPADGAALAALEKTAASIAIRSLASLARAGDIDHLGGGLELIPALLMTLGFVDYDTRHFTIEHGHTSIGYYAALSALGFLPESRVIDAFRRSLDIAGHVSCVAGRHRAQLGPPRRHRARGRGPGARPAGAEGPRRGRHLPLRRRRLGVGPGAERVHRRQPAPRAARARDAPQRDPAVGADGQDHGPRPAPRGLGPRHRR